jgi:hypothetical protein
LKNERVHRTVYATKAHARSDVITYIEDLSRYAGDPLSGRRGRVDGVTASIGDLSWRSNRVFSAQFVRVAVS